METHSLYNGEIELCFNPKKHAYTVGDRIISSVTGIIKIIDKSGPLMWWAVNEARDYIKANLKPGEALDEIQITELAEGARKAHQKASGKAAGIGTLAHKYAEKYFTAWLDGTPSPQFPVNKEARVCVETFRDWLTKHSVYPIASEFKIYLRDPETAGTCDLEATIDNSHDIADFKTGKAIYPEMWLQLAAYWKAREEETGTQIDRAWILRFPKDGGPFEAVSRNRTQLAKYFETFKHAHGLHTGMREIS